MPVWHDALQELRAAKKIEIIGVIQEQHADRCRLFAQWKQFDWPIVQDKINLLGARAVPIVIGLDEHGVVRNKRLSPKTIDEFIAREFAAPDKLAVKAEEPDMAALRDATDSGDAADWRRLGDALTVWHDGARISEAVSAYRESVDRDPKDAAAAFRLGVALRRRYEAPRGLPSDFQNAVKAWEQALDLDPNHYIYRRRIQQYGPRLTKPYPFYDWVATAREEIRARGEEPHKLPVEPSGAEIANPSRSFASDDTESENPDPDARITRDRNRIRITPVAVPASIAAGGSSRIHMAFEPRRGFHWNNEAEPVKVWIDAPEGWKVQSQLAVLDQPKEVESKERRTLELEVQAPKDFRGQAIIKGFALYFVCDDNNGSCYFVRGDFSARVAVK